MTPLDYEFDYIECRDVNTLMSEMKKYIKNKKALDEVKRAYFYAEEKHKEQKRKNGDPFIVHPLSSAYYLAQWRMGPKTIIAGLLHDVIEDTPVTFSEVEEMWGTEVADIVEAVTKVSYFTKENREQMKANYLRKLFLSMIRDIRVIIVKIADRMHNLLTLKYMSVERQKVIAKETLEIYSTIAHRIGMKSAKNILEDYSFYYLNPQEYNKIKSLLEEDIESRKLIITDMINDIYKKFKQNGLQNDTIVFGRSKTIYSIYRKMNQFGKSFSDINDILAIRIITPKVDDCYKILGWIHSMYTPLSGRFKDYIATPKNNLYQSIHTTLANKEGIIFEVQIRTNEMDDIAEHGAAAHWKYKEGERNISVEEKQKEIDQKVDMFTRLMNLEKLAYENLEIEYNDDHNFDFESELEETFKSDYLAPLIYILTPDGTVVTMPFGSTVLDFAYKIHTEIGNTTVGGKINGVFSPYNTILNSGEMVEIQTSKEVKPQEKWLRFVRTAAAKKAIEAYLADQKVIEENKEKITNKKIILKTKREIDKFIIEKQLKWKVNSHEDILRKLEELDFKNIDEFLLNVGKGHYTIEEAVNYVFISKDKLKDINVINDIKTRKFKSSKARNDLIINGISQVECTLSSCCYPIPYESVVSFITKSKGIQVHRNNCINIKSVISIKNLLKTSWNKEVTDEIKYCTKIKIETYDRPNLFLDLITLISNRRSSIQEVRLIVNNETYIVNISLTILVSNLDELNNILTSVTEIPGVISVKRSTNEKEEVKQGIYKYI
ncbi:RelA/SpoT family protein [Spiroplasma turonicum]|uniref:Penta-phosphate guanosine-3'-pyrophosphohydrolase n=1 Tax=Spiroplasma turonicum TaxID=216946 RepID=A0A0K1P602_9MOLU|nr:RelA/SpoT family protein [Spiroplasma turonicum]AKU79604.1 GTP pyrophosphokinase [Spiroplasma turonicum]ALX70626.1 GTP pyrophosphokinase [Spiroplasma turonicum]